MKKKGKPLSHAPRKHEKAVASNPEVVIVMVDGEGNIILYVMCGAQLRGLFISDCCRGFYV